MSGEKKRKHIGYMVQNKQSGGSWYNWLSTQSPTKECSILRFDYATRRGAFKREGKDARVVHTFIEEKA